MDDKMEHGEKPSATSPKKSNKPQMEKKRRERINNSLNELKSLILGAMKKDASYYSKLEKADILEMAVDHVRNLQKQLRPGQATDSDPMAKYRAGFVTCASEVTKLVMGFPGLDENVKFSVLKHLANCCTGDQREGETENSSNVQIKSQQVKNQERDASTSPGGNHARVQSPLSQISQIIDSRTVGEKRLIYQQICNRQSVKRTSFSPDVKSPHGNAPHVNLAHNQYTANVNATGHSTDGQKGEQLKNEVKATSNLHNEIGWINTNSRQLSAQGCKLPHKSGKPDGSLIKPVPQMPEKIFISNGIRFMPATVLVPVQVGYSAEDCKQTRLVDERSEVWRPWEKMGHFAKESQNKLSNNSLVS